MNNDAKFLWGVLKDQNIPFDDNDYGRRAAVAKFIKAKTDEIKTLEARVKELESQVKGNYIPVNEI